jgi:uncharacterized protein YbjT (DUF2867 family)
MYRILVAGATGTQGGSVVDHLLGAGPGVADPAIDDVPDGPITGPDGDPVSVRALTRDASGEAARALADRGVEVVEGDLTDRAAMDAALDAVDALFFVPVGDPDVQRRQGEVTVAAAVDAGLSHVVVSTGGGADEPSGIPNVDAKHDVEERLRASGLRWTILGPHSFASNFERQREEILAGRLAFPIPEGARFPIVDQDDVGRVAARAFADPDRFAGERIELAGEAATLEDLADTFASVIGRDVTPVRPPGDATPSGMARFVEWLADRDTADVPDRLRREYDVEPRTLADYLRRTGWTEATPDADGQPRVSGGEEGGR